MRVLFVMTLAFTTSVNAQLPPDVRDRLAERSVVAKGSFVYAKAAGSLRGTREASESFYATVATRNMAHFLCDVAVSPGKRLEAKLEGLSLVSSTGAGPELEVVVRAPAQKPSCKVVVMELATALPPPPAANPLPQGPRTEDNPKPLAESNSARQKDIVIRNFGGEY
jgi:hypothetical protein